MAEMYEMAWCAQCGSEHRRLGPMHDWIVALALHPDEVTGFAEWMRGR